MPNGEIESSVRGELVPHHSGTAITPVPRRTPALSHRLEVMAARRDPDERVSAATDEMYWDGIPENTQKIYTAQWRRYLQWCADPANGPAHPREALPASVATLREYVRAHETWRGPDGRLAGVGGRPYAPTTVELALAVISVAHKRVGLPSQTGHPDVVTQLRGYRRRWKRAGHRPDRAVALSPPEVVAMLRTLDLHTVQGLRNAAAIRLAADIGRRNSELMALDWADLSWPMDGRLIVEIPFSKTNRQTGDDEPPVAVEADVDLAPDLCPIRLLRAWRQACADAGLTSGPVFRKVRPARSGPVSASGVLVGSIREERMGRNDFWYVVGRAAALAGVDRDPETGEKRKVSPHSLRRGMATYGDEAGVPVYDLADRGGWSRSSPVILQYMQSGVRWGQRNPAVAIRRQWAARADEAGQAKE